MRLLILASSFLAMGSLSTSLAADTPASLYEAARKEGKVVVWTSQDVSTQKRVEAAFAKRYPGIAVEPFKIEPAPAVERAVTQANAGRNDIDIIVTNVSYLPMLFDRGLVQPYPWTEVFGIGASQLLFDSRAIIVAEYDYTVGINTDLVKPGSITSWESVLEPQWRGKVLLEARGIPVNILAQVWGEDRTVSFLKRLLDNKPTIIKGSTVATEALTAGQGAIAVGTQTSRIQRFQEDGAPVDWARIGPVPSLLVTVVPITKGPHPNAARLWAAFWTQKEAQDIQYEESRAGMLTGDKITPRGQILRDAKLEVVRETSDIAEGGRLLEMVGAVIAGKK